jgi:hypothetical protein
MFPFVIQLSIKSPLLKAEWSESLTHLSLFVRICRYMFFFFNLHMGNHLHFVRIVSLTARFANVAVSEPPRSGEELYGDEKIQRGHGQVVRNQEPCQLERSPIFHELRTRPHQAQIEHGVHEGGHRRIDQRPSFRPVVCEKMKTKWKCECDDWWEASRATFTRGASKENGTWLAVVLYKPRNAAKQPTFTFHYKPTLNLSVKVADDLPFILFRFPNF